VAGGALAWGLAAAAVAGAGAGLLLLAPAEAPSTSSTVALPAMDASMGFWDFVAVPERPEAARPPMPASMGHWDFTLPAEPTDLEITHDAVRGAAWAAGRPTDQPAPPSAEDGYAVVEGPFGYEVVGQDAASMPVVGPAVRPAAAHTGR
jgi:hypothetical protein